MTTESILAAILGRLDAIESKLGRLDAVEAKLDAATGGGVTLAFLAEGQRWMLEEIATLRADMTVLTGIVMRLDASEQGRRVELAGVHEQQARLRRRLDRLEADEAPQDG
jgi:hypothetical protein